MNPRAFHPPRWLALIVLCGLAAAAGPWSLGAEEAVPPSALAELTASEEVLLLLTPATRSLGAGATALRLPNEDTVELFAPQVVANALTRKIAHSANDVCTGEIIQTQRRYDLNLSKETYFKIIRMKTAALFACAGELAAALNGCDEDIQHRLHGYGDKLGMAYQIYDDVLDLVGDEEVVGKTLGTDLEKGKLTLPILNLLESATESQRATLNRLLLQQEPVEVGVLAGIADYAGAIRGAVQTGCEILAGARADLMVLPPTESLMALEQVTHYLEARLRKCLH